MANTPRLNMPYLVAGQAQKEITHNDALNDLDSLAQISVINRTTATPPAAPAEGDSYIIAASPTGAWAGNANAVASYYSGWRIKPAKAGWMAYVQAEAIFYMFDGNTWWPLRSVSKGRTANTFAFLGASRLSSQFNDATSTAYPASTAHVKGSYCFFNWANALMTQSMKTVYNGAVTGQRSDQYLVRLTEALNTNPAWVVIFGVTNDIIQSGTTGDTALTIWTRIKNAANVALAYGANVILMTESGSTAMSGSSTQLAMLYQYNQYLREFCDVTPGAYCFDYANVVIDPNSTSLAYRAGYSYDGLHLNQIGSYYVGLAFKNFIANYIPTNSSQIYSASEISTNGNIQQLTNPLFLTTTAVSGMTGISGTIPTGYVASRTGSATATLSVAASPDGYGNALTFSGTFTAAGEVLEVHRDATLANISAGDVIDSGVHLVLNSGSVNLATAALSTNFGTVSNPAGDLYNTNTSYALPSVAMDLTLRSVPFVIPSGITWASWQTKFVATGAGSFTALLNRPWMRRRFAA